MAHKEAGPGLVGVVIGEGTRSINVVVKVQV